MKIFIFIKCIYNFKINLSQYPPMYNWARSIILNLIRNCYLFLKNYIWLNIFLIFTKKDVWDKLYVEIKT